MSIVHQDCQGLFKKYWKTVHSLILSTFHIIFTTLRNNIWSSSHKKCRRNVLLWKDKLRKATNAQLTPHVILRKKSYWLVATLYTVSSLFFPVISVLDLYCLFVSGGQTCSVISRNVYSLWMLIRILAAKCLNWKQRCEAYNTFPPQTSQRRKLSMAV